VAGPGARKLISQNGDWFVLAVDMTALPTLSVNLEQLPDDARGYAVIEVREEADIQPLKKVSSQPALPGKPSIWAACEFGSMRALRQYFPA